MPPRPQIEGVRRFVDGLPVQVETDGSTVRFIWTGGDVALQALGFDPPLPTYASRDDVPVWLLRRPGKSQVPQEYKQAMLTYWRKPAPSRTRLMKGVADCAEDALRVACEVAAGYNDLLELSVVVTAVAKRQGLPHDRLPRMWKRATGYLRDGTPPPDMKRHPYPSRTPWEYSIAAMTAQLGDNSFSEAVTQRARMILDARDEGMDEAAVLRAREVVLGGFWRAILNGGDSAVRPTLKSFWTWPYTADNADQAFLGVMAMRLFENTSADDGRHVERKHGDADDFHFIHAPFESRSAAGGGLLVLKRVFQDRYLDIEAVLETMTNVWPLYGGGTIEPVQMETVKRRFHSARSSNVKERLKKLKQIEEEYGLMWAPPSRYEPPHVEKGRTRAFLDKIPLYEFVPLAASVAVQHELAVSKREGIERPFG